MRLGMFALVLLLMSAMTSASAADRFWVAGKQPLDGISATPAAAYGLRKLRAAYAGSAIRVRRSSDNTEQDIGFTAAGDLDTSALTTFVGGNSGYVSVWYDQSGATGRNATQSANNSFQPRIVNAGTVDLQNGRPTLIFSGGQLMENGINGSTIIPHGGTGLSGIVVGKCGGNDQRLLSFIASTDGGDYAATTSAIILQQANSTSMRVYRNNVGNLGDSLGSSGMFAVFSGVHNGSEYRPYTNGVSLAASASTGSFGATGRFVLGANRDWDGRLTGCMSEAVAFTSAISTADRTFVEASQGAYFAVPNVAPVWSSTANWSSTSGGAPGASVPTSADTVYFDSNSGVVTANLDVDATVTGVSIGGGSNAIALNAVPVVQSGLTATTYSNNDFTGLIGSHLESTPLVWDATYMPLYLKTYCGNDDQYASVRWTGQVLSAGAGNYTFYGNYDGSMRLWVNGTLVFDDWAFEGARTISGSITLAAATWYDIDVDYRNDTGGSRIDFLWSVLGAGYVNIPQASLRPTNPARSLTIGTGGLTVASNGTLTGGAGGITVAGSLTQTSGTITAPSGTLAVAGNFARSGGTFTANGGTVLFNGAGGTTQAISGSSTFNHVQAYTSVTSPAAISGCRLWLDAADAATFTTQNDSYGQNRWIKNWQDKSGNRFDCFNYDSSRNMSPLRNYATLNGLPVVSVSPTYNGDASNTGPWNCLFSGSSNNQGGYGNTIFSLNGANTTVLMVHRRKSTAYVAGVFSVWKQGTYEFSSPNGFQFENKGVGATQSYSFNRTYGSDMQDMTVTAPATVATWAQTTLLRDQGLASARVNGTLNATETYSDLSVMTPDRYVLSDRSGADGHAGNDYAELLVYNRALSVAEIALLEGYLNAKWGFSAVTPSARTLQFASGTTQTISGTLTLQGSASQQLSLVSSTPGSIWTITPSGTKVVSGVRVQDSTNTTAVINPTSSTNAGNTTNWFSTSGKTWIATTPGNWNTGANWSPAGVPANTDTVYFNSTYNGNCTLDVAGQVAAIYTSGYGGTFAFGSQTLTVATGDADLSGITTVTAGTGTITFTAASGTQVFTPRAPQTNPAITHTAAGTLRLGASGTVQSFSNSSGVWDLNGKILTTIGNCTVTTGTTTTMSGLSGAILIIGGNGSFTGQAGNLLNLHPGVSTGWTVTATGTLTASYATVGKSNASGGSTGVATDSIDAGGNQNWSFGTATWYWNPSTAPLAAATRSDAFTSTSLDPAWTFRDNINEPVYSSMSLTANPGKLTITGRGGDIWSGQFGYVGVHRSDITGDDFDVSVYVASQTNTDGWAKAGIFATNSIETPASGGNGAVFITPGNGATSHWAGGGAPQSFDNNATVGGTTPCYLRLTRSGVSMTAYYKKNLGDAWTQIGSSFTPTSTASGTSSKIALVSCSHTTLATCTTVFDDFTASNSLPNLASAAHWTANQDGSGQHPLSATDDAFTIGALDTGVWSFFDRVAVPTYGPGSVAVTGGAVAITSEGWHMIDDVRDEFAGIKRADITGDFDVSVQVVSQVGGPGGIGLRGDWALSGLVIANDFTSLTSGGYCGIMATTGQGIGVTADGNGNGHLDSLSLIGSSPTTRPTWLRLTRKGTVIKGYYKTSAAGAWSAGTTISPVNTGTNLQIALVSCGVQTGGTYSPIVSTFDDFQGGGTINGQDANLSFNGSSATKSSSGILGAALSAAGIDCTGANNYPGTLDFNGLTWSDYGNANFASGGAMAIAGTGGGTLAFRGSAAKTFTPKSDLTFPSIQQNGSGTTTLATNDVTVTSNVTITSGTLNAGGRNITLGGNWSNSGTFTPSTGTVTFTSQGTQTITGNTTFNNLTATPFLPTQLSGCSAWYDAADTGSVTASSGNLTQWRDKAGGNYHLGNINTPRYNDKTLNGLPVVTCPWNAGNTGQGHSLWTSSFAMTGVNTTIFMVHQRVTGSPNSTGVLVLHSGGGASNINLMSAAAPSTLNVNQSEGLNIDITQPAIDAWGLTVMRRQDGTGYLRSSNTSTLVEGYDAYTPGTSLSPDRLTLNTRTGLDGAGINDFAEVILYNRALSTSEQAQVESYLADKWALGTAQTRTMQFAAGSTQTVNGTLNLQGSAGNLLALRSSSSGSTWSLTPNGTRTCSYVDVQDGINTVAPVINPANSTNSGNTTRWFNVATDRYWIAGAGANWNNTANWSATSGGAGGASVPTAANDVYFDASGLGTCTVDTTPTILSLNMAIGYTGALAFGTNTVTVAGSADLRSGGTFTGTSGGLTISATGTLTPPAATTIPTLTVSGGTATLATNALSVAGNLTISGGATLATGGRNISVAGNWANGGTFTHGSATVTLTGAGGSTQVISGSTTFNNLTATTAFVPTDLPGCRVWLDAADAATFTTQNDSYGQNRWIKNWQDKSGNRFDCFPFDAVRNMSPLRNYTNLNGLPVVSVSPTYNNDTNWNVLMSGYQNNQGGFGNTIFSLNAADTTVLMVHRRNQANYQTGVLGVWKNGSSESVGVDGFAYWNTGTGASPTHHLRRWYGADQTTVNASAPAIGTWAQTSLVRNAGLASVRVNGVVNATDTYSDLSVLGPDRYVLSGNSGTDNQAANDLAEVLIYNRALGTQELARIEGYLSAKWGFGATTARTLQFTAGTTQTISGTTTVTGVSGGLLSLRSTSDGSTWTLAPAAGTRSISYVDVKDGINTVAPAINPANSTDSLNNTLWFPQSISGTVYEDVNYGGGVGRPSAAAGAAVRSGARVELFNASNAYVSATTTDGSGNYSLTGLAAGNYIVRVVSSTVTSSRTGYAGSCLPVLTWRATGTSGSAVAVLDHVGGLDPATADAGNAASGWTLNPTTGAFGGSGSGKAHALAQVTVGAASVTAMNFGFNFDVVSNANNSGQGSLRQAIFNANTLTADNTLAQQYRTAAVENLVFMISNGTTGAGGVLALAAGGLRTSVNLTTSGVATITVTSALPDLASSMVIDASCQPGWTTGPLIDLYGPGNSGYVGLKTSATNVVIRSLCIRNFTSGLSLEANSTTVQGCYIGTTASGLVASGHAQHGLVINVTGSHTIGGTTAAQRNVIAASWADGIHLSSNSGVGSTISGNYIGVGADGTTVLGNGRQGIRVTYASNNVIGGTAAGSGNLIRGSLGAAGGTEPGAIRIDNGEGNRVLGNAIFGNTGLAIDLLGAAGVNANDGTTTASNGNLLTDFPVITTCTYVGTTLTLAGYIGTAPGDTDFAANRVEFFISDNDASGYGEGQTYLDFLTSDASGNFSGSFTVASGITGGTTKICATATSGANNTSEFSGNVTTVADPGTRYWVAAGTTNWSSTSGWAYTSGDTPGAAVPTSSNAVYFNGSGVGTCTIDVAASAASLTMVVGYTGTVAFGTNTLTVAGSADLQSGGTFTGTSGGLTISATGTLTPKSSGTIPTLTVSGGTTTLATNDVSLAGTLTISAGATLTTGGRNLSVAGNWANSGTFTHGSNTVTLNGAGGSTQVISGSTTFNNLTATAASARTLQFTAGTTQTVASALTLTGASGQLLSLTSTTNGSTWNLDPQGTRTCSYLSVRDGNNTRKPVIGPTYSTNVSGNTWWFTQGLSVAWGTGTTGVTAGATSAITWSLGSVLQAAVRTTHPAGSDALDFTVLNGSDVGIVLTATGANSTDWTLAALPGADQCVVGVNTDASATYSSLHAGGVILNSGLSIGAEQGLDLKFIAPVTTTKAGTTQTVSVTLTATAQ